MQASAPVRGMYTIPSGQMQIRAPYNSGPRMQYPTNQYVQMQQSPDVHQGGYIPSYQVINTPQYQYQPVYTQQTGYNPQMYVVRQSNPGNYVVHQQPMPQNPPQTMQQPRPVFIQQPQQIQHHSATTAAHPPPETHSQPQKKRTAIKLTDPNTGKDLTNEVFKKKEKTPPAPRQSAPIKITAPQPSSSSSSNEKLKANAAFAAQVAALQH